MKTASDSISVIIGGDVCPIGVNEQLFNVGKARNILGSAYNDWMAADIRIINLECPLTAAISPIRKTGPTIGVSDSTVAGLVAMRVGIVGLANNHIMDHGYRGLLNTIQACKSNGIQVVGAGVNLSAAAAPLMQETNGIRIGILAFADMEWSIVGYDKPGALPFTFPNFLRSMQICRKECDFTIVLLHMGKESYPLPSPELQDTCRCLIEEGANVVICQHSHCVGAYEHYAHGFISYGQGNFLFDWQKPRGDLWNLGYLIEVTLSRTNPLGIRIIPYEQSSDGTGGLRSLSSQDTEQFILEMQTKEIKIQDRNFVEQSWSQFCKTNKNLYLGLLRGYGRIRNRLNRLFNVTDHLYSANAIATLENVVRCKAHREVLEGILRQRRHTLWGDSVTPNTKERD
jgi:poly-gamma-glutamate synthesis protein (capsule biosynthesis protein)